ncbi:amidase domain-containing protein [Nocardia colli]|uniref:amidase domain-containing protein n=1 Tax=Nocardia colli TaxID=2545717 RepID=UPI0035DDA642
MVTYAQLRAAKPDRWLGAADDLLTVAKQAERTVSGIHANGIRALDEHWSDATGSLARATLTAVADRMVNLAVLVRGAATALYSLGEAIAIAQREAEAAVEFAYELGLTVDGNGRVGFPPDYLAHADIRLRVLERTQGMIADALTAAAQADQSCVDALERVAVDPDLISKENAQARQSDAGRMALQELRNQLPDGLNPQQVEQWWQALTERQRENLMRAVPVELCNLPGFPESVKKQLTDDGRGYDPVQTVRWALANAGNSDIDVFSNNCANFVSHALRNGGLEDKSSLWNPTTRSGGNWGTSLSGNLNVASGAGLTHTRSWYNADAQRRFFLDHGGARITPESAKPGDIVYFNHADGPAENPDGKSFHTAVVTAVLPDGEVLYTQHNPNVANLSLQGRLPTRADADGGQDFTIMRPKQTW